MFYAVISFLLCEMSQGLAEISTNYSLCKSCWSPQKHLPSQHNLPVIDSLLLPSDTCIYFGLQEFCMILLKFKGSMGFIWDIHDGFCSNHTLCKVLFIETVKVISAWEGNEKRNTGGNGHVPGLCTVPEHIASKCVCCVACNTHAEAVPLHCAI